MLRIELNIYIRVYKNLVQWCGVAYKPRDGLRENAGHENAGRENAGMKMQDRKMKDRCNTTQHNTQAVKLNHFHAEIRI